MLTGACGISCDPGCGLYSKKICKGCNREFVDLVPCPILKCAVDKDIEFCSRDCEKFPCDIFQQQYPYSEAYIRMFESRLKTGKQ